MPITALLQFDTQTSRLAATQREKEQVSMELSVLKMKLQRAEDKLAKANSLREEKSVKAEEKSSTSPCVPAIDAKHNQHQQAA